MLLFLSMTISFGQVRLKFDYDAAGNQVKRYLCINCTGRLIKSDTVYSVHNDQAQKSRINNVLLTYYPNPVKEELYISWEAIDQNNVEKIQVFSLQGKLLNDELTNPADRLKILQFSQYPQGYYIVLINYSNGESQNLKIIKK